MDTPLRYSPHPPEAYTHPSGAKGRVGIGREMIGPERLPHWNLYWLSDPGLDDFLADAETWNRTARGIDLNMFRACYLATKQKVGGRTVGEMICSLKPTDFVEYLKGHRHKHLAPYKLRRKKWVDVIEQRSVQFRGLLGKTGNVLHANFRVPVNSSNKRRR